MFIVIFYRPAAQPLFFRIRGSSVDIYDSCHKGQPGPFAQCDSVCTGQNRTMQNMVVVVDVEDQQADITDKTR